MDTWIDKKTFVIRSTWGQPYRIHMEVSINAYQIRLPRAHVVTLVFSDLTFCPTLSDIKQETNLPWVLSSFASFSVEQQSEYF